MARQYDPGTKRVMPVLTKPDLIETGSELPILCLLRNERTEIFEQGFHMVKCRAPSEMTAPHRVTLIEAEEKEARFFQQHDFWQGHQMTCHDQFGIVALRKKLSRLYMEQCVEKQVPQITRTLKERRDKFFSELEALGVELSTPEQRRAEFRKLEASIVNLVKPLLSGARMNDRLTVRGAIEEAKTAFDGAVRQLPEVSPLDKGSEVSVYIDGTLTVCSIHDTTLVGEERRFTCLPLSYDFAKPCQLPAGFFDGVTEACATSPPPPPLLEIAPIRSPPNGEWCQIHQEPPTGVGFPSPILKRKLKVFTEDELMRATESTLTKLRQRRRSRISLFEGEELFNEAVVGWVEGPVRAAAKEFIQAVDGILRGYVAVVRKERLPRNLFPGVDSFVQCTLNKACDATLGRFHTAVDDALKAEHSPQTMNHYFTETLRKLRNKKLKQELLCRRQKQPSGKWMVAVDDVESVFTRVSQQSIDEFVAEGIDEALQAYLVVAAKRVIDNVVNAAERELEGSERGFCRDVEALLIAASNRDAGVDLFDPPKDVKRKFDWLKQMLDLLDCALRHVPSFLEDAPGAYSSPPRLGRTA